MKKDLVLKCSVSQSETKILKNKIIAHFYKDEEGYHISMYGDKCCYTIFIFNKFLKMYEFINGDGFYYRFVDNNNAKCYINLIVRDARDDIEIKYRWPFSSLIIKHKYFDKFIAFVENLRIEDLEPDPFCG